MFLWQISFHSQFVSHASLQFLLKFKLQIPLCSIVLSFQLILPLHEKISLAISNMDFVFSVTAYITDFISVPTSMGDLAWVDTPITDFTLFASAGRFCSNWYSITDFTMFATTAFKFKFHFSCSFPFISHDTYIVAFIAVATSLINIFIFVAAFIDHGWFLLSVDFTWVDTSMAHIISAAHCTFRLILSLTTSFHSLLTYVHRRFNLIYYFYHQFHLINHFHRRLDFSCRLHHRFQMLFHFILPVDI